MATYLIYSQNPDLFELLRDSLQTDHKLYFALNSERLEYFLKNNPINILLYDKIQLNRKDIARIEEIRQRYPDVSITVMYMYFQGNPGLEEKLDFLVRGVINKPCDLELIPEMLLTSLSTAK